MEKFYTYKCPKNCNIRLYPLWVGEEAEKCPKCEQLMVYKGAMTQDEINEMQRRDKQSFIDKIKNSVKSKKQLKKRKRK